VVHLEQVGQPLRVLLALLQIVGAAVEVPLVASGGLMTGAASGTEMPPLGWFE